MSYHKVIYDKLFPYAPYLNEHIGLEILVEVGQAPMDALMDARGIVHDFYKKSMEIYTKEIKEQEQAGKQPFVKKVETPKNLTLIEQIQSCTELKVLESYRLIAKSKPELQTAYDNTFKNLTK